MTNQQQQQLIEMFIAYRADKVEFDDFFDLADELLPADHPIWKCDGIGDAADYFENHMM